jgi:hypothetical protein
MRKIYTKLIIDIDTGKKLEEEFFMYDGEMAFCTGIEELAAAGLVTSAVGTAVGVAGQMQAASNASEWANYNASVAKANAAAAQATGEYEKTQQLQEGEQLKGRQIALYAKAGVATEGTPTNVILDTAANVQMDADMTLRNYMITAGQYTNQAQGDILQGQIQSSQYTAAAAGTLLTGMGQGLQIASKIPTANPVYQNPTYGSAPIGTNIAGGPTTYQ